MAHRTRERCARTRRHALSQRLAVLRDHQHAAAAESGCRRVFRWLDATAQNPGRFRRPLQFRLSAVHRASAGRSSAHRMASPGFARRCAGRAPAMCHCRSSPNSSPAGPLDEDQWTVDGASECVVPANLGGPFQDCRALQRRSRSVSMARPCRMPPRVWNFNPAADSGSWCLMPMKPPRARWDGPLKAAIRLLADSGFGGERGRGWGRTGAPSFTEGQLPRPHPARFESFGTARFRSALAALAVFACRVRSHRLVARQLCHGRAWRLGRRSGMRKRSVVRMIEEGSVLAAPTAPAGRAPDVAPDGFPPSRIPRRIRPIYSAACRRSAMSDLEIVQRSRFPP